MATYRAEMKVLGYISVILVAGLIGFAVYPSVFPTLVQAGWVDDYRGAKPPQDQTATENGEPQAAAPAPEAGKPETPEPPPAAEPQPKPEPAPPVAGGSGETKPKPAPATEPDEAEIRRQLAGVGPDRLPEKILLKDEVTVTDPDSGLKMKIDAGGRIKPVRIEGLEVVVSPAPPYEGRIAVTRTDLLEQLREMPPAPEPKPEPPPVVSQPGGTKPAPQPKPEPAPAPAPKPAPKPPVAGEGQPGVQPPPAQPEPAKPASNLDEIVKIMKSSIRAGQIQEFTYDQVIGWKGVGEEEIDGETYLTGLVAYKAKTIFGTNTIQAKALIQDGKVVKWIWPKSGMVIK